VNTITVKTPEYAEIEMSIPIHGPKDWFVFIFCTLLPERYRRELVAKVLQPTFDAATLGMIEPESCRLVMKVGQIKLIARSRPSDETKDIYRRLADVDITDKLGPNWKIERGRS
jgi:hypothetical protein